jgi:lipopolysaccharide/colanic/teichoic acid biosynthesis glycosyltransferase
MIRIFNIFVPAGIFILFLTEIVLLLGSYVGISYAVLELDPQIFLLYDYGLLRICGNVLVILAVLYLNNLYGSASVRSRLRLAQQICLVFGIAFLVQAVLAYFNPDWALPRWLMIEGSGIALPAIIVWRLLFSATGAWTLGVQRILFVGIDPKIFEITENLQRRPEFGLYPLGYLAAPGDPPFSQGLMRSLGTPAQLASIASELKPQRISVAPGKYMGLIRPDDLIEVQFAAIDTEKAPETYEAVLRRVCAKWIEPADLIFTDDYCPLPRRVKIQSVYAFFAALTGALVLLPLIALVAIAVKLSSQGPMLSTIPCLGLNGKEFDLFLFRTSAAGSGAASLPSPATEGDPRLSRLGALLRKTRLERLPMLFNVLRGEMSIVGPRPEPVAYSRALTEHIPFYPQRFLAKPGLTGWSQINWRAAAHVDDSLVRFEYDLYYVKNLAATLDLYIVLYALRTALLSAREYEAASRIREGSVADRRTSAPVSTDREFPF